MKMNKKWNNTVSIAAAVAIVGMIGLSGCGAGDATEGETVSSSTLSHQDQTMRQQARATIVGRVVEDRVGQDRRLQSVDKIEVTAINLDTNKRLTTTAQKDGTYRFDNVELGDYQIVAKKRGATVGIRKISLREPMEVKVEPVVLTATGMLKGQVAGYNQEIGVVYIPGTSYIAIPDDQGKFELNNVPVGDYTLRFVIGESFSEDYYNYQGSYIDRDVHVDAEGTDLGLVDLHPFDVKYAYIGGDSVNALNREGIHVYLTQPATKESIETSVKLYKVDPATGDLEAVDIEIDPLGAPMPDNSMASFRVKPVDEVTAGKYRLVITNTLQSRDGKTLEDTYTKDYTVRKYIDMYTQTTRYNSNYKTKVILEFPETVDPADKDMNVTIVDDEGKVLPNLVKLWKGNTLILMGDFEHNKHYTVQLPDNISEKYGQFRDNKVDFYTKIWIESISNSWSYKTPTLQKIQCSIANSSIVDLSSIRVFVTVDGAQKVEIPKEKLQFNNSYYWNDDLTVSFEYKVPYSTTYTVEVTAKDIWGEEKSRRQVFTTITPTVYNFVPSEVYELVEGRVWVHSNVAMQEGGNVRFTDENNQSNSRTLPLKKEGGSSLFYDLKELGRVGDFLKPAHVYRVTLEGVRTEDGNVTINVTPQQIITPPVSIVSTSIRNGAVDIDPEAVDHHVMFNFFGFLSDEQKAAIEGNLTITSYRGPLKEDNLTHPSPKIYWDDHEQMGSVMGVAFTMDPGTNYEIGLKNNAVIPGVVIENKLLTFKTQGQEGHTTMPEFTVINQGSGFNGSIQIDRNESGAATGYSIPYHADFRYPIDVVKDEYGNERCGEPYTKQDVIKNVHLYDNINNKEVNISQSLKIYNDVSSYWNYENGKSYRICYQYGYLNQKIRIDGYDRNVSVTLHVDATSDQYRLIRTDETSKSHMPPFGTYTVQSVGDSAETYTIAVESITPMNIEELNASLHNETFFKVDPATKILSIRWNEWNSFKDDQNNTYVTSVRLLMAKPKYSLVNVTIGGGDGVSGLNLYTGQPTAMMTQPTSRLIEIHPDLTPLKVTSVKSEMVNGELNRGLRLRFNRAVKPEDVATFNEEGNLTDVPINISPAINITEAQLETEWIGSNIEGVKSVLYILQEPMDANQTYQVTLKDNRTIETLTETYEIKDLNMTVQPVLGELDMPTVIGINYSLYDVANENNPLSVGTTVDAQYGPKYQVDYPLHLARGVDVHLSDAVFEYNYYGTLYPADKVWIHDGKLITSVNNLTGTYGLKAHAKLPLSAGSISQVLDKKFDWLSSINYGGITSAEFKNDGTIHLTSNYNSYGYSISDNNFEVSKSDGTDVNSSGFYSSSDNYSIDLNATVLDLNTTYCANVYDMYGQGEYDDRFCFTTPESW